MERDKFMSAEEAVQFGLIDKILTHPESDEKNKWTRQIKKCLNKIKNFAKRRLKAFYEMYKNNQILAVIRIFFNKESDLQFEWLIKISSIFL